MSDPAPRLAMSDVNALDRQAFVARFGALFEDSPWIAAEAWDSRPWSSPEALHAAMLEGVARASQERQLALIQAHPDLVGRAALAGTLSKASTAEQRAAGLDPDALTADEIARFQEANAAYQAKFGFPFVICARENTKDAIVAGLGNFRNLSYEPASSSKFNSSKNRSYYLKDCNADTPNTTSCTTNTQSGLLGEIKTIGFSTQNANFVHVDFVAKVTEKSGSKYTHYWTINPGSHDSTISVPEPSTFALFAGGLLLLAAQARRGNLLRRLHARFS